MILKLVGQENVMRRAVLISMLSAISVAATANAHAAMVEYMSRHPIPRRVGHGLCDIDVPHFHDYPPTDPRLYRQVNGAYYFVGDPTPFGYDGPRYAFYGPHPIVDGSVQMGGPAYCYIRGPHYHWYAPEAQASFEMRGGVYWYTGAYDPVFYADEPEFAVVNDYYGPLVYARPVVDVQIAPPGFHGELVVGGGPRGWRTVRGGPEWRRDPELRGQGAFDRRDMVARERREAVVRREDAHRGFERERHGGPEQRGWPGAAQRGGLRGGPLSAQRGWRGGSQPPQRGSHVGPAPERGPDRGGGWRGPTTNAGPSRGPSAGGAHAHENGFRR
jgi:hypothetical protein